MSATAADEIKQIIQHQTKSREPSELRGSVLSDCLDSFGHHLVADRMRLSVEMPDLVIPMPIEKPDFLVGIAFIHNGFFIPWSDPVGLFGRRTTLRPDPDLVTGLFTIHYGGPPARWNRLNWSPAHLAQLANLGFGNLRFLSVNSPFLDDGLMRKILNGPVATNLESFHMLDGSSALNTGKIPPGSKKRISELALFLDKPGVLNPFFFASRFENLESLWVRGAGYRQAKCRQVVFSNLLKLTIEGQNFPAEELAESFRFPKVEQLEACVDSSSDLSNIPDFLRVTFPRLETLRLRITASPAGAGVEWVLEIFESTFPRLTKLVFENATIGFKTMALIASIAGWKLMDLEFRTCRFDKGVDAFFGNRVLPHLAKLSVSNTPLHPDNLFSQKDEFELRCLDIADWPEANLSIQDWAIGSRFPRLRRLNLDCSGSQIPDHYWPILRGLPALRVASGMVVGTG